MEAHRWIALEKDFFGQRESKYDFKRLNIGKLKDELKRIEIENEDLKKKTNFKVDALFEKVEIQYIEL